MSAAPKIYAELPTQVRVCQSQSGTFLHGSVWNVAEPAYVPNNE